jgi:hypothetical protein
MRRSLVFVAALLLGGCGGVGADVKGVYGGESNWAVVEAPEKVTAYRVIRPGILKYVHAPETIGGFEITDGPFDVDAATATELRTILADDSIYDFERAKGCDFDPGVAFRFAKAGAVVDLLLCFSCDELAAYQGAKRVGGEDFDPARPRLLAIVKRLFPGDEKLQGLR